MVYLIKTPRWLRILYPGCLWEVETANKALFLTFDDGPHPLVTPFVLDELARYNAKGTFFCIGKNVAAHPEIYRRIIEEGHSVGNHTQNHLNGKKSSDEAYLNDIAEAKNYIDSPLFRPPYGKISRFQLKQLSAPRFQLKPVMWSVLSGDFDVNLKPKDCLQNVLLNSCPGAIIVYHDSEKADVRLRVALPGALKYFSENGYSFERLEMH